MKICLMANAWSIHTKRWSRFFLDKGHEVHIISKGGFNGDPVDGVELHIVDKITDKPGIISEIRNLKHLTSQVKRLIREVHPDIINAHYISVYGVVAASTGFHPYVATVWGSDVLQDIKKSPQVRISVKRALAKADRITLAADHLEAHLINNLGVPPPQIVKIPWGVDLSIFHQGYVDEVERMRSKLDIDPSSKVVLSNRSHHPIYNIENIVRSIPLVLDSFKDVKFVLLQGAGENEYTAKIRDQIKSMGIEANVRIVTEMLSPRDMAIADNMADAFISIPSSDQFGLTILEAMACGPVPIVSNLPGYGQYLVDGKNALFVDQTDPRDVADGVVNALSDEQMKKDFFERNLPIVTEKENWEKNATRMESLFLDLIS